jgi:hypothetical protein
LRARDFETSDHDQVSADRAIEDAHHRPMTCAPITLDRDSALELERYPSARGAGCSSSSISGALRRA